MSDPIIEVSDLQDGIVQIRMQDRANRNGFTVEFIAGLTRAFADVSHREDCRVVVLTGYDGYFSSGGTQEGLRDLYAGKIQFTDRDLYSLALNCPIPVVAAMQGHGIGGGFVMGMFADVTVLAREAVYTANFMKYGFTPGMGSTFILPEKLGSVLAHEMMLTAATYRGEDFLKRGVQLPIVAREQVLEYALDAARSLAEKPRVSLVTLKNHLTGPLRAKLPAFIEQEIAMHELTFHQPEVKSRIEAVFGK